ncbi:(Fe-S)-binding protein [Candidatus Woesearchaeota archaeon]|nr:(Fe-S)-binding protein [Candidatus Woesearchaeota archaeon]
MGIFSKGKVLYHPGPLTTAKLPQVVQATKAVLKDFGIEFVTLDLLGAGFELWYGGFEKDFRDLEAKNRSLLEKHGIGLIITNDPHEAWTFKERYGIEAKHITQVYREHIEKIRKGDDIRASYHHPCFLDKLEVTMANVQGVLRRAGVHATNKGVSCCGSVGHDNERNDPEGAAAIAKARLAELPEKLVVTCCPHCHLLFKKQRRPVKDVAELLVDV